MGTTIGHRLAALVLSFLIVLTAQQALAYEVEMHREISDLATRRSSADSTLIESLGLLQGLVEEVRGTRLINRLREGSVREDRFPRFFNHFHNPTVDWLDAGFGGNFAQSAILWGQNPNHEAPRPKGSGAE